jgi:hypothetical protein
MTIVYWTPDVNEFLELEILFAEPESLYKHIQKTRKNTPHIKCPAFLDFIKNTYVIKSPFDYTLRIDKFNGTIQVDGLLPEIAKTFVLNRGGMDGVPRDIPYTLSMPPVYLFYSNDDVLIEYTHPYMETNSSISNLIAVPGTFNISKWIRGGDCTYEVKNDREIIRVKKDDPLLYIKFRPADDSKVELERVKMTEELSNAIRSCTLVKNHSKNLALKTLYKMAESFIKTLSFRQKKKCPFGFGKK